MDYYSQIKDELINNEVYKAVKDYSKNRSDLQTYYNVGKLLSEAGKHYGEGIIKKYSERLIIDVGKKYDKSTLFKMRKFYVKFSDKKVAPLAPQLTCSHCLLLIPINDINEINYYINQIVKFNLSKRDLGKKIKKKEYQRLPQDTKDKLITKEDITLPDMVKNPIIIKNKYNTNKISEKILQQLILEDLPSFLKELGNGFSFIDNEYKIKIGHNYNYIDNHIKSIYQNKTIGIIICKEENSFVINYASDDRILQ